MFSTVAKNQREWLHSHELMEELKQIEGANKSSTNFILKKEKMMKQLMIETMEGDMAQLEELREKKKKLAEEVFGPLLEEKGIFFKKKEMTKKNFKEFHPRLLQHGEVSSYHINCHGKQQHHSELPKSLTPTKQPKKVIGSPSFMNRKSSSRLKDRIPPSARDARRKKENVAPLATLPINRHDQRPKSSLKAPKQIEHDAHFMRPLQRTFHAEEEITTIPKYGGTRGDLSQSQVFAVSQRLFEDANSCQINRERLWTDMKKGLFKPCINQTNKPQSEVKKAIQNFDKAFLKMEKEKRELIRTSDRVFDVIVKNDRELSIKKKLLNYQ